MGSIQAHEARLNRSLEKSEEKVFQVKGEASSQKDDSKKAASRENGKARYRSEVMVEAEVEKDPMGKLSNGNLLMIKEVIKVVFNATAARSLGM